MEIQLRIFFRAKKLSSSIKVTSQMKKLKSWRNHRVKRIKILKIIMNPLKLCYKDNFLILLLELRLLNLQVGSIVNRCQICNLNLNFCLKIIIYRWLWRMNLRLSKKLMIIILQIKYLQKIKVSFYKFLNISLKKVKICLMGEKTKPYFSMKYKKCYRMQKFSTEENLQTSQLKK